MQETYNLKNVPRPPPDKAPKAFIPQQEKVMLT